MLMKKILLLILSLSSLTAFGQNGFFLQPLAGIGVGNIKTTHIPPGSFKYKFAPTYELQFGIGYQYKNLIVTGALGYKQSVYCAAITFTDGLGALLGTHDVRYGFNHISLPVTIGYRIKAGEHLWISPVAGVTATCNYSGRSIVSVSATGIPTMGKTDNSQFKTYYKPISTWATMRINMDIAVNSRMALTLAPSFDYMVTGINKYSSFNSKQHNYTIILNAGIKWYLHPGGNNAAKKDAQYKKE